MSNVEIVQLPHPGKEHKPVPAQVGAVMPWNRGDHARKFLLARGTWTDGTRTDKGELVFWGEWEAQSEVIEIFARAAGMPRWLHRPFREVPADGGWRQNTDPLVFGDQFVYSNCKQAKNKHLRRLVPGSVILFGSKVAGEFVLDTCLVVDTATPYHAAELVATVADPSLRELVAEPLASSPDDADQDFTLYRGATAGTPMSGMFSFVPCVPREGAGVAFARPTIRLKDVVNPNLAMSARRTAVALDSAADLWQQVVDQVLDAGLLLSTHLETPPRAGEPANDEPTDRTSC